MESLINKWIASALCLTCSLTWAKNIPDDLSEMSLEALMNIQVTGTSKYTQKASEAPADITVITADEIKTYGWRTLAELLNSVRSFSISSDLIYSYAGIRGFSPPGDYNDRLLLLINGHRINDNIYDQAYIGTEFPVDIALISKVEISRGPGSALYGGNALFGIVNVITKQGESIHGNELYGKIGTGEYGSVGLIHGTKTDNNADILLAASGTHAEGKNYTFPEFTSVYGSGLSQDSDYLRNARVFGSFSKNGFSLMAFASERTKGNPGSLWSGVLDSNNNIRDKQAHIEGSYTWALFPNATATTRLFMGYYNYHATGVLDGPPLYMNYDDGTGQWWGGEFKVNWKTYQNHRMIAGAEFQHDSRQNQTNTDSVTNLDDRRSGNRIGTYWQDDWHIHDHFNVVYGIRLDRAEDASSHVSPRLAGIWKPDGVTTGKLMYGTAFRTANMYELHYAFPGQYVPPTSLQPETINTLEAEYEKIISGGAKITTALFRYTMKNQITLESNPNIGGLLQYTNSTTPITGTGAEIEFQKKWSNGIQSRASFTRYFLDDPNNQDGSLNSPAWLAKINLAFPPVWKWVIATELNSTSSLQTNQGHLGSQTFLNLNFTRTLTPNTEFSFLISNVLNKSIQEPVGDDSLGLGFVRNTFPTPGREMLARLTIHL